MACRAVGFPSRREKAQKVRVRGSFRNDFNAFT
jgi:hypothetical protein